MHEQLQTQILQGDIKALARAISLVENEQQGYENILQSFSGNSSTTIIGVTGPPGAGKSTLVDAMIGELVRENKKVAVLCIDPSSPFNLGALLGDRIRMSEWYTHPNIFIRSLATRGSVGGLAPKVIEITDLIKSADYDHIIIETVGVGQSEIEIAGLADITLVVIVPESGDEVQTMKAGLMEIADIFIINKADRPGADLFEKNLRMMMAPAFQNKNELPVIKTVATEKKGIPELMQAVKDQLIKERSPERHLSLLTEKAWQLLISKRMRDLSKDELKKMLQNGYKSRDFNLYSFINKI
jgi:LAO/AO transport system kinase